MITILFAFIQWSHAVSHKEFPKQTQTANVKELLRNSDQLEKIKNLGPQGYKHLRDIMLSSSEPMGSRWQATIALARIGGKDSQPDIEIALNNPIWYMRSAGLLATSVISQDRGVSQAKKYLRQDPALLVRATALQIVAQEKNIDRDFLWSELYNPLNFHKGESLSLRLSLLKVLAQQAKKHESSKFVSLMNDKEPGIKKLAKHVVDKEFFISKNSSQEQ